jgi:hypothetical protein
MIVLVHDGGRHQALALAEVAARTGDDGVYVHAQDGLRTALVHDAQTGSVRVRPGDEPVAVMHAYWFAYHAALEWR